MHRTTSLHWDSAAHLLSDAGQAGADVERPLPRLLQRTLRGRDLRDTPALLACYGPMACMRMDFARAEVFCDPLALQNMRLHRALPQQVAKAALQKNAVCRSLDEALWDLGIAAADFSLLDAPMDCWHTPISCLPGAFIRSHSRRPLHLEGVGLLQTAPLSPERLRRRLRASELELRELLQACLLLGQAVWVKPAPTKVTS